MRIAALVPGLAAAVVLGGWTSASAQDGLITEFKTLCYDHPGDAEGTLAAADAAGWGEAPRSMMESKGNPFQNSQGRIRSRADGLMILFTGDLTQDFEGTPVRMTACMVAVVPMAAGFNERFRRWAGTGPLTAFGQADVGLYAVEVRTDGSRVGRDDLNPVQASRLMLNNELHIMAGQNEADMSMAMYMVPSISE